MPQSTYDLVVLGGVMVSVFAIGPKVRGFKPGRGDGLLRAIKIRSTPSFGGEVKPNAHVIRTYAMLENPSKYGQRYFVRQNE
jgi:hypothetical protein